MQGVRFVPLGLFFGVLFVFPPCGAEKPAVPCQPALHTSPVQAGSFEARARSAAPLSSTYGGAASDAALPAWSVAAGLHEIPAGRAGALVGALVVAAGPQNGEEDASAAQERADTVPEPLHESHRQQQALTSPHSQLRDSSALAAGGPSQRAAVSKRSRSQARSRPAALLVLVRAAALFFLVNLLITASILPPPAVVRRQAETIEKMVAQRVGNSILATALQEQFAVRGLIVVTLAAAIILTEAGVHAFFRSVLT
ncbi:conserved hypothetical protein [Neospora caninum Liverpool]|uniref:Transmembrane protein n=1 Tax=Neospora caninum (strain Liverpool) TaxID=572307 RepID=F0V813_NEOCL|nr:conserved hypothetical protein [Neospora caninum Liverpool]CBZ49854.1 conserved hypothetical protein [Neospora caninum Liverpool]CEL64443.1 TPA: hypothetical protein BN1204_003390 [Neospora caninum Liverpool]|eukprot:XP_003879889.1 conserved hypothetical protein [Neospora caninum Liverpool]